MAATPPLPPPPTRAPPLPAPPTRAPPTPNRPPSHPTDTLFREYQVLERRLPTYCTVYLTLEERALVPADLPDVFDLTNAIHALALVGPNARFTRAQILELHLRVRLVANAVRLFKQHGDTLRDLKILRNALDPGLTVETVEKEVVSLRAALEVVHETTDSLKGMVYELRLASANSPPMAGGGVEPRVYPVDSAEWVMRPIYYFKEEVPNEEKHDVQTFARWTQSAVNDPSARHLVLPLLQHVGAYQGRFVDVNLVSARMADYMKHFKSSLPRTAWLVDGSKRRGAPPPPPTKKKGPKHTIDLRLDRLSASESPSASLSLPSLSIDAQSTENLPPSVSSSSSSSSGSISSSSSSVATLSQPSVQ